MREKLISLIGSVQYGNGSLLGNNFQKGFIEKIADHLIANGVTIPVCCKNCKYHKDTSVKEYEHCCLTGKTVMDDDYCSYGENKSDNLSL